MKTIIAGSRSVTNYQILLKAINNCDWSSEITEVVSGKARGVDTLGEVWANTNNIPIRDFPADWKDLSNPDAIIKENDYGKYDARAGIRRNEQMGNYADALICVIQDNSKGSAHMIEYMQKLGKKVFIWKV